MKGKNNPKYKFGQTMKKSGWYNSWQNLKGRCLRPSHPKYPRYGGRGITICDDWLSVEGFKKWVDESGWFEGASIDRIDNDKGYSPENCRWITMSENSRKKRTTKITFVQAQEIRARIDRGECEYALADEYRVVHGTIWFIKKKFTHVPELDCIKALKARNIRNQKL